LSVNAKRPGRVPSNLAVLGSASPNASVEHAENIPEQRHAVKTIFLGFLSFLRDREKNPVAPRAYCVRSLWQERGPLSQNQPHLLQPPSEAPSAITTKIVPSLLIMRKPNRSPPA
jgi:hypothetical protein